MLTTQLLSVIPKKTRCCLVSQKRPINVNRSKLNNEANMDLHFLPLPVVVGSTSWSSYRNELNTKHSDEVKRYRYIGYSNQSTCVPSINLHDATQFKERLSKAAELYDGWFSRNVENLDLAPSKA